MIVSPSEIGTYKRCKRKWRYYSSNASNLEPFTTKPAFVLGNAIHKALATWLSDPDSSPEITAVEYMNEYIRGLEQEYIQRLNMKPSVDELQPLFDDRDLAQSMMANYKSYWKTAIPDTYKFMDYEQEVQIDIPGTPHQLMCRLDGLLTDSRGNIFILEHKTYDQKPNPLALVMDEQFTAYVWAAKQLGITKSVSLLYDGMWKRPGPPRGRVFEDLFNRQVLYRSKTQLYEFEHELVQLIKDMETAPEYKTVPWNGCVDCAYVKLCQAETNREDVSYIMETFYRQKHSREAE